MSGKKMKQAFLYLTIDDSPQNLEVFTELSKGVEEFGDAYLLFHAEQGVPDTIKDYKNYTFTYETLHAMNYKMVNDTLVPYNVHFPILRFWHDNPQYDYYWVIEDDVRFNGDWHDFFDAYKDVHSDLLACHIRRFKEEPEWLFWLLEHPTKEIPESDQVRSFNPISRLSNAGLQCVHEAHIDGWEGHFETLIATTLDVNGLKVTDFGGDNEFSAPGFGYKYYTEAPPSLNGSLLRAGTMRYRPLYLNMLNKHKNKLYHPVKLPAARNKHYRKKVKRAFEKIFTSIF